MRYIAFCAVFVLLLVSGCQSEPEVSDANQVQVEDVKYSLLPGGARIVSGTLFNPSEALVKGAQIQISLFDSNNIRVSSMSITVKDVPAGERKAFRQPVDTDLDIKGASVRSVLVL
ncbi:MAG: FxLYD domain-containing protein [Bacteroidota bacterium]